MSGQPRAGHDAIIVGGGHNGMVAAFYLARAGLRAVILERRPFVGGMAVTEEFAPGYRASTGAYVLAMLREAIWRDMRLAEPRTSGRSQGPSRTSSRPASTSTSMKTQPTCGARSRPCRRETLAPTSASSWTSWRSLRLG